MLLMILHAALIGFFAVVYRHILAYEDILNWWFRFGSRFEDRFFYKPIWGCELCIAGQIAFWSYSLNWIAFFYLQRNCVLSNLIHFFVPTYQFQTNNALECFIFVSLAIGFAFLLFKGFRRLKD